MNIFKSRREIGVWGSSNPKQLMEITHYLNSHEFEGPTKESDPYMLEFVRKIDSDLQINCSVARLYEGPEGVFNFQTFLGLTSFALCKDEDEAKLWGTPMSTVENNRASLFSVGLQHLKWNAEGGDINPIWQVSVFPEYERSALDWIKDWERYAMPIVDSIKDISTAIDFCLYALKYQKNPWVKSDGFGSPAFEVYTAMLMARNQQVKEAKSLLVEVLKINDCANIGMQMRAARKVQFQKGLDWLEKKYCWIV